MTIEKTLKILGLSCTFEFIPFSQSRNKAEKHMSLNYRVTCLKNGRPFLTTDYGMGSAHVPGQTKLTGYDKREIVRLSCETGRVQVVKSHGIYATKTAILPKIEDVYYSLVLDSDVLDYSNFEQWASEFGYNPDSIKGEKVYRACLEISLALRGAVGDAGLQQLRDAYQDY